MVGAFPWFQELPRSLKIVGSLTSEQFEILRDAVMSPEGYDVSAERCQTLADKFQSNIDVREIGGLLSSLQFLYQRSREWVSEETDLPSALREFILVAGLQDDLGDEPEVGYERLSALVTKNPALERRRKVKWLQTGILDTATGFSSFVELRPNYTDDRSKIDELIPVVIFRITAETEIGDDRAHVFQLTSEGLKKLREAVDDVEKKLKTLQTEQVIADRLHKGI